MIQFSGAKNDYGWMSNFYRCDIRYKDLTYKSSEAAWQAQKTLDEEVRKTFQFMTPAESKRAGRKVTLRPDWESVKYSIMVDVLTAKFSQNVQLLNWLMLTGKNSCWRTLLVGMIILGEIVVVLSARILQGRIF